MPRSFAAVVCKASPAGATILDEPNLLMQVLEAETKGRLNESAQNHLYLQARSFFADPTFKQDGAQIGANPNLTPGDLIAYVEQFNNHTARKRPLLQTFRLRCLSEGAKPGTLSKMCFASCQKKFRSLALPPAAPALIGVSGNLAPSLAVAAPDLYQDPQR